MDNFCVTCSKKIDRRSVKCSVCSKVGRITKRKEKEYNKCKDCNIVISRYSTRCNKCAQKGNRSVHYGKKRLEEIIKRAAESNRNNGKRKTNYCINCNKVISRRAKRCQKCAYIGELNSFKGKTHSEEVKMKLVKAGKERVGELNPCYGKERISSQGENNPNWKGGITPLNKQIRHSIYYKNWIREVFKRDNYKCVLCGKSKCYLNADHIKPFYLIRDENGIDSLEKAIMCRELWDINNGRALCIECHKNTDTFGWKSLWKNKLQ